MAEQLADVDQVDAGLERVCELVSIEETSTQVQVVFLDALGQEGLLELIEVRQDAVPADTFPIRCRR